MKQPLFFDQSEVLTNPNVSIAIPNDPKCPQMDERAYHGLAGEIVQAINPVTEADPVALLIQLLTGVGSIIGRTACAEADGHTHYLNLFSVLAGSSSKGRKGSSWARIAQILRLVDEDWLQNRVRNGLVSAEGMTYEIRDSIQVPIKGKQKAGEKKGTVLDPGVKDKRLLCMESEFVSVLKNSDRKNCTLSCSIRDAWDGAPLGTMAKNSPARCLHPHVSIIGHTTIQDLLRNLHATEFVNGFGNRFLWMYVRRSKLIPHGGKYTPDQKQIARLNEIIHWSQTVGQIGRDRGANKLWEDIYPSLSAERAGQAGALLNRAEPQVLRLSCLYALLDHSPVVRAPHLQAALAVWDYSEQSVRHIFGCSLGNKVAERILEELRHVPALDRTDISKLFHHNKSQFEIHNALKLLQSEGLVASSVDTKTGGGKREIWTLRNGLNERNGRNEQPAQGE
jgi:hypothetical protein